MKYCHIRELKSTEVYARDMFIAMLFEMTTTFQNSIETFYAENVFSSDDLYQNYMEKRRN